MIMPRFIDVEASSLDNSSYPIEIAWSNSAGHIESYLINPYAVDSWNDWDYCAQQLHGISRKQCGEEGVHPRWLCERLSQSIAPGQVIFADGLPLDEWWIDTLFEAGSDLGYAQFRILSSDSIMLPLLEQIEPDTRQRQQLFEQLKTKARQTIGGRHRAALDVHYLIQLYKICLELIAR
jgi:hypothetical protein